MSNVVIANIVLKAFVLSNLLKMRCDNSSDQTRISMAKSVHRKLILKSGAEILCMTMRRAP